MQYHCRQLQAGKFIIVGFHLGYIVWEGRTQSLTIVDTLYWHVFCTIIIELMAAIDIRTMCTHCVVVKYSYLRNILAAIIIVSFFFVFF